MNDLSILPIKPLDDNDIQLDPRFFKLPCVSLHVAPPKSGKSVIINNILMNPNFDLINKLDIVYVFSPTARSDSTWRFTVEQIGDTIFDSYSDKKLRDILEAQNTFTKKERPRIGIIFDDFLSFPNLTKNSLMFSLATNYRHYGIYWCHYASQKFKAVPPVLRACLDYCLVGKISNQKEVEDLNFEVGYKFNNQFKRLLNKATSKQYSFLYLKLNHSPPEAYECFNNLIYTAKGNNGLDVDFKALPDGKKMDDEELI